MNKHLQEAFLKQKLRRQLRSKIRAAKLLPEASLYSTFVEPFTDVIQAVQLGAEDFLNSYITFLRMFITWDPKKAEQLLQDHDRRRSEIAAKWAPLMERTDAALSTGDADVLALVFANMIAITFLEAVFWVDNLVFVGAVAGQDMCSSGRNFGAFFVFSLVHV